MGIKYSLIFIGLLINSCSTIDNLNPFSEDENASQQEVEYLTIETPACSRAVCKISNTTGDVYFMNTPDTINIKPAYQNFEVTCFVEEVKEYDDVLPMTMWLYAGSNYLKHDFACPLTDEEVIVKTKLEKAPEAITSQREPDSSISREPDSSIAEADVIDNQIEVSENTIDTNELESKNTSQTKAQSTEENLTESQIKAIAQLTDLYERKMISEEIFNKEITAIKQKL